jgi:hypothetical protein
MEEKKRNSYTVIAIAALAAILLGCVAGALAGGVAGFLVGRHEGQLAANRALDGAMSDLRQLRPSPSPRLRREASPQSGRSSSRSSLAALPTRSGCRQATSSSA